MKRNFKRYFCLLLTILLCLSQAVTAMAATSTYAAQIKKLGSSIGVAKTQKLTSASQGGAWGNWCKTQGLISTYIGDMNNDNKTELVVSYLKKVKNKYTGKEQRELHLAVYTKSGKTVQKTSDIVLDTYFDSALAHYAKMFIYTYKGQRYIAFQNYKRVDGAASDWWIFSINKNGKLQVKTAITDPGYTSGTALFRYSSTVSAAKLATSNYYNDGIVLYNKEEFGFQNSSAYVAKLKKELSKYGLSVSKKSLTTVNGSKSTFMQLTVSGGKPQFAICANSTIKGGYKYTYQITDYTKTASKM